jgi:hypothetical protein
MGGSDSLLNLAGISVGAGETPGMLFAAADNVKGAMKSFLSAVAAHCHPSCNV